MFQTAAIEYRYQFGFTDKAGTGFQTLPRAPIAPAGYVALANTAGNATISPGGGAYAALIRNDGTDPAMLRWGAVPVAAGLGGVFILNPGTAVVVEPGEPALSTGALSYVGGPLTLAWGVLIAETGAPTR